MKRIVAILLCAAMLLSLAGCGGASEAVSQAEETHLIGVEVYSASDPEMRMMFDYLKDYIAESFPVEFIISESLNTAEEELAFVETVKEQGGEAILALFTADLNSVVAACEENEIYYIGGSSSMSDEEFAAVKDNPWYLGVIGISPEDEYEAGVEMAKTFLAQGAKEFLIVSGGAGGQGNDMHYNRTLGMLDTIVDTLGLSLSMSNEELAAVTELTTVNTGKSDVELVISPGYVQMEAGYNNFVEAMDMGDYDALMSVVSISTLIDIIESDINASTQTLLVGVVDCFSSENYEAIEITDKNGDTLLNFVHGKYASMIAPSFVAVFNAIKGDADLVNPNGEAFRLYQSYWTATSEEEYVELYGYTQSIYVNAFSSADLMEVIRAYNEDATYEAFVALTQSTDVASVRERLGE